MRFEDIFTFSDLADSPEFERFYTAFWKLTNIPLGLIDIEKGGGKLFCPEDKFNPICKTLRSSPKGKKRCLSFDDTKLEDAAKAHEGICYKCYAGLMDFSVPIYVRKRHIATIMCGQVLPEAPTEAGFIKLWNNVCELGVDKQVLRKVYFESTYMSSDKINSVLQLLSFFADYFCEVGVRLRILERANKYPEIGKAKEYLKKHFQEPIALGEVADYIAFSPSYFSRLFAKVEGMSFTQYLQSLRLEETKALLRDTETAISKIAFNCGFSNLSYFNTFFRKTMKCSPRQYRAKVRQQK